MIQARLAIDVDSGDFGTQVVVKGVLDALQSSEAPFQALLCGDEEEISRVLLDEAERAAPFRGNITVVHCRDKVKASEIRPIWAWRQRKNASIIRCITLQKKRIVDASVSAGDTAVLLGAALFILGRRKGAPRPALAAFLPTMQRKPVLLLDVGANLKCRKEHLTGFALLGIEYVSAMSARKFPTVALLNVGLEKVKGYASIRDADKLLRRKCPEYIGYIEGNRVLSGEADVVVCEGFAGNALLKTVESFRQLLESVMEGERPELLAELRQYTAVLDPELYGAVPFLGIRGIVFKAHGSSSIRAIASAVLAAERTVRLAEQNSVFR